MYRIISLSVRLHQENTKSKLKEAKQMLFFLKGIKQKCLVFIYVQYRCPNLWLCRTEEAGVSGPQHTQLGFQNKNIIFTAVQQPFLPFFFSWLWSDLTVSKGKTNTNLSWLEKLWQHSGAIKFVGGVKIQQGWVGWVIKFLRRQTVLQKKPMNYNCV